MNPGRLAPTAISVAVFALGVGASQARPATRSGHVTISMLFASGAEFGFSVLIANFERVYPNITVDAIYAPSTVVGQLEATELAAGNAPDLFETGSGGCSGSTSLCALAKAGYLAPMVKAPWVKRSLRLVISDDKYGQGLFGFTLEGSPYGVFTNDDLFRKLGLAVPQTFAQLLAVCQKAKATGTPALIFDGASVQGVGFLLNDLAGATVYGKDKHWNAELKAGTVSFDGTPGWHQALQEFIDMNDTGCFQPGMTGTTISSQEAQFAQGQGLMAFGRSSSKGGLDAANPQFSYSFYPIPGGTNPNQTRTVVSFGSPISINAHASAQNQAAAQTFVDFIARPKQNALFAQTQGGLTQYQFLKAQIPSFMSSFAPVFKDHEYVVNPTDGWNANVGSALQQNGIGLITGQRSIDDILNAMDAAWKQGPS